MSPAYVRRPPCTSGTRSVRALTPVDKLAYAPATEVAARIRGGELTSLEVVEACLRRIERIDPELGAFAELDEERALAAAGDVRTDDPRAFAGVPIAIKSNVPVAGLA